MTEVIITCPKCSEVVYPDTVEFSKNMDKNVILFRCPSCKQDVEYKL